MNETTQQKQTAAPKPSMVSWYRCRACGYETSKPRSVEAYREPLRCADYTCDGPVLCIGTRPVTLSDNNNNKPVVNQMTINTLEQDLAATKASNDFRVKNGMTRTRNPYSWWKYMFVALTFYPDGTTVKSLLEDLASIGVTGINKTAYGLLTKVANQEERDPNSRNYAFNLPGLAQAAGLVIAGQKYSGKRPAYIFKFRNTTLARAIMLQTFPETAMFFKLLDKKL